METRIESKYAKAAAQASRTPSFNRDVAPILFNHCVACHRPNGVGPMSLLTFDSARAHAERIRQKVGRGEMPPWYADRQYGQFKNARTLTQAQIDTLIAWIDGGTPQGEGKPPAPPGFPPDGWHVQLNKPLFRDRGPFPWDTISSAGQGPVNARLLWEAGISYGYGTDTSWHPRETLADELRALQLVFSPKDIVAILTRNAAISAMKGDQLGTLEAGKHADMVVLDGDPLANVTNLSNIAMVIKGGEVVVEKR